MYAVQYLVSQGKQGRKAKSRAKDTMYLEYAARYSLLNGDMVMIYATRSRLLPGISAQYSKPAHAQNGYHK